MGFCEDDDCEISTLTLTTTFRNATGGEIFSSAITVYRWLPTFWLNSYEESKIVPALLWTFNNSPPACCIASNRMELSVSVRNPILKGAPTCNFQFPSRLEMFQSKRSSWKKWAWIMNFDTSWLSRRNFSNFNFPFKASASGVSSNQADILQFSTHGFNFPKHRVLLTRLIPGQANQFPTASLSIEEQVSQHD